MNDKELIECYEEGNYENLNLGQLQRLKALLELKQLPKKQTTVEMDSKVKDVVDTDGSYSMSNNAEMEEWIQFAQSNKVQAYEHVFEYTDSDENCPDNMSDWTPSEFFTNYIFSTVADKTDLLSACKVNVDMGAGNGDNAVFRLMGSRTAQGDLAGCNCMSCTSNSWSKYEVTVKRFGDFAISCGFDEWQAKDTREELMREMARGAVRYVNSEIWDALDESTPGYTETLSAGLNCSEGLSGSCCSNSGSFALYHAIINLVAAMEEANYEPDTMVLSPTVAALLKYKDNTDTPFIFRSQIELNQKGQLIRFGGLKVIETGLASTCTNASAAKLAFVFDSRRSLGVVWGKRPTFNAEYRGDCDSTEITYNAYFGVDSLDDSSIGVIVNP